MLKEKFGALHIEIALIPQRVFHHAHDTLTRLIDTIFTLDGAALDRWTNATISKSRGSTRIGGSF
ncbi:MAG: hypothetical protein ACRECQ_10250, partial [Burkholderiaceae bacterium]